MLPDQLRKRDRDGGPQPHTRVPLLPGSRPWHKEDGRGGRRAEGGRRQQTEERSAGKMSESNASAKAKTKAKATTKAAINKDKRVDGNLSITKDPGTNVKFRTRKKLVWQDCHKPGGCTNTSCKCSHVCVTARGPNPSETNDVTSPRS